MRLCQIVDVAQIVLQRQDGLGDRPVMALGV
jgi:hypothetical protein